MKVAIVIDNISAHAGTERAVCNLANILCAHNIQVTIVSINTDDTVRPAFTLNTVVQICNLGLNLTKGYLRKAIAYPQFMFKMQALCKNEKFDLVITTRHGLNCLLPLMRLKCKKIACEHFNYTAAHTSSRFARRLAYPLLDAVVLLTHHDAEKYTFVPPKKRFVIPNSLSFTCDTPSNCEKKRIIALGRLDPQKGFDYLLQTAVKLKKEIPDWHIDIFGSGDDETMLKDLARKLQVDDFVTFNPPTKGVIKELCDSGMYVMSSRWEGLPMVLLEAQECGLPIVSFDCPEGPSEIIHEGKDGFIVPLADTDALAEKIITLAKNEEMRKEFGRNAKINCKQFSPERVSEMWMDLIHKLTVNKENKNEI